MKKHYIQTTMLLMLIGSMGCSKEHISQDEYLRCNDTSAGLMAETESGFITTVNSILYYADKEEMETWVAVCNKANCMHLDDSCNAYVPSEKRLIQKEESLYGMNYDSSSEGMYIFEIKLDGSGMKKVYEFPEDDKIILNSCLDVAFSDQMVVYYGYLDEFGKYQKNVIALREDEKGNFTTKTLYEENVLLENSGTPFVYGNAYWTLRGDDVVLTNLQLEDGETFLNTLTRIGENELEKINLPKEVDLMGGYLSGDIFTYYEVNEGFYEVDIYTGEKTLIFENQLNDAWGYIFSEDYMVECNRFDGYQPEEAYLKFYNGTKWIDIELPESVKNSDGAFYPIALASDRIFYQHGLEKGILSDDGTMKETKYVVDWYYFYIEEDEPELIYFGEVPNSGLTYTDIIDKEVESSSSESEDDGFEDVVVFDNEKYLIKVTDAYAGYDSYNVDIYVENKSDVEYRILANYCAINGLQCNTLWGDGVSAGKTDTITLEFEKTMLDEYGISELYTFDEYTSIELGLRIREGSDTTTAIDTFITIYPQGEEHASAYTRESKDTDIVLLDNEYVTVVVTGYSKDFVENDTIQVYLENKTNEYMRFHIQEASVNGISQPEGNLTVAGNGFYYVTVNPGKSSVCSMTLFDGVVNRTFGGSVNYNFLKNNDITSIEEIEFKLEIYNSTYALGGKTGSYEIIKTVLLNP